GVQCAIRNGVDRRSLHEEAHGRGGGGCGDHTRGERLGQGRVQGAIRQVQAEQSVVVGKVVPGTGDRQTRRAQGGGDVDGTAGLTEAHADVDAGAGCRAGARRVVGRGRIGFVTGDADRVGQREAGDGDVDGDDAAGARGERTQIASHHPAAVRAG